MVLPNQPGSEDRDAMMDKINQLIVVDDDFATQMVTRVLDSIGITQVTTAEDGSVALDCLAAAERPFDLVICDIQMPEMDGYEFVRGVRYGTVPAARDVPILMLTGQDTEKNLRKARIHKIDGFIVKPPKADVLERHIRQALGL